MSMKLLRDALRDYDEVVRERDELRAWIRRICTEMNLSPAMPSRYANIATSPMVIIHVIRDAKLDAHEVARCANQEEKKSAQA
jgi:hypothetical protein